jgi:ribonucleoside-diphosphate reductase alpha chain
MWDTDKEAVVNVFVTVSFMDGRPFEVFATTAKGGEDAFARTEGLCRMVSLLLRSGADVDEVVRQLRGIRGGPDVFQGEGETRSVSSPEDAIALVLETHRQYPALVAGGGSHGVG